MLKIKDIKFVKDGDIETYDADRMNRYLKRIGIPQAAIDTLIDDFYEEVNEYLRVEEVVNTLERVASRRISPAHPEWEDYAGILYLAGIFKKDWNSEYPSVREFIGCPRIDQSKLMEMEDIFDELDKMIKPERDRLFNYKAIMTFHSKYCLDMKGGKKEMPQLTYMRIAMFLGWDKNDSQSLEKIRNYYEAISQHWFTLATPIMVNSLTIRPQTSSCVLLEVGDDTRSLLNVNQKIGVMSANLAGTACNIQKLRARGSKIDNGYTSGPVPFIKVFEATVSAWNQGGTRPGALCVYFQWWHRDVMDLLALKSNGGTDENRARRLKYAVKLNDFFIRSVLENKDVAILSPHEAKDLYGVYGQEFEKRYEKYLQDPKTTKISARSIWVKMFKERVETGNIYLFHEENVNSVSMLNRYIGCSNLCTEVVLPTAAPRDFEESWEL